MDMREIKAPKILHVDNNHPILIEQLNQNGFINDEDLLSSKEEIEAKMPEYEGIVVRSRFSIDKKFIDASPNLKFIARAGAGLETIDCEYAESKNIALISTPEGNRTAVGEHAMALLLALINKLNIGDSQIRTNQWLREANRGIEIEGKTVGIIGYGNMGKSFAKLLKGFDCKVICYDIKSDIGDENATQVSIEELQRETDILSLHTPQTPLTLNMINSAFINGFSKPFWFINTARGKSVNTADLVEALKSGKILGAGLDVLEYERPSFKNMFQDMEMPEPMKYLIQSENVLLSPHVAGWTVESKEKIAQVIVDKIKCLYEL